MPNYETCKRKCDALKVGHDKCEICRTINLAKIKEEPKPNMEIYEKCTPQKPCPQVAEAKMTPYCMKVCTREEEYLQKSGPKRSLPKLPTYPHGIFMYAVKAGVLVGAAYFTYLQGVWGDQKDSVECVRRWQEYSRSLTTRRPPTFDQCGNVIVRQSTDTFLGPIYDFYKSIITTCFSGVVKIPLVVKCAYVDYMKALEQRRQEELTGKKREATLKQLRHD